jgi:hypothetical protein
VQHELVRRVAVNLGYFRTSFGNFTATDNRAVTATDFDQYCITAPADSRLPGGGGQRVCGLYDVSPSRFGLTNNLVTRARDLGTQTEVYNGVDLTFNARLPQGMISAGMSTGATATDNCEVVMGRPQITFNSPNGITAPRSDAFCMPAAPWLTQFKVSGTYQIPWDINAGWTYQNLPGIPIYATYVATNAEILPSLGRNLAAGVRGTATIDLIEPQTAFEDRITQLDIRLAKIFRLGRTRLQGMFDIYNVLNASPVLAINSRYGTDWLRPTQILDARMVKFGAQLEF